MNSHAQVRCASQHKRLCWRLETVEWPLARPAYLATARPRPSSPLSARWSSVTTFRRGEAASAAASRQHRVAPPSPPRPGQRINTHQVHRQTCERCLTMFDSHQLIFKSRSHNYNYFYIINSQCCIHLKLGELSTSCLHVSWTITLLPVDMETSCKCTRLPKILKVSV